MVQRCSVIGHVEVIKHAPWIKAKNVHRQYSNSKKGVIQFSEHGLGALWGIVYYHVQTCRMSNTNCDQPAAIYSNVFSLQKTVALRMFILGLLRPPVEQFQSFRTTIIEKREWVKQWCNDIHWIASNLCEPRWPENLTSIRQKKEEPAPNAIGTRL